MGEWMGRPRDAPLPNGVEKAALKPAMPQGSCPTHSGVPSAGPHSCTSPPQPSPAACLAGLPSAYWKRKLLGRQRVQQGSFGEARLGSAAGTAQLSMLPGPGPVTGSVCSQ